MLRHTFWLVLLISFSLLLGKTAFADDPPARALDLIPEDAAAAIAIDNLSDLKAKGERLFEDTGMPRYSFTLLFEWVWGQFGINKGVEKDTAAALAMQTGLGAARMALENDEELPELRRRVTSPGGTTERAIASFEEDGLREVVRRAMGAAADRAAEMAREMG